MSRLDAMSRLACFAIVSGGLLAASGCSSCFGGGSSCRRPSFMEVRSPCGGGAAPTMAPMQPCGPACAPACEPACAPAAAAPCCEGGAPVMTAPGTFS